MSIRAAVRQEHCQKGPASFLMTICGLNLEAQIPAIRRVLHDWAGKYGRQRFVSRAVSEFA